MIQWEGGLMAVEKFDIKAAKQALKDDEKVLAKSTKALNKRRGQVGTDHTDPVQQQLLKDVKVNQVEVDRSKKYLADLEARFAKQQRHKK